MITHSKPDISKRDIEAVARQIESGILADGDMLLQFEASFSKKIGVRGGVATNSGTAALHLALLSLGVKSGDEVILPGYVCVSPLLAIRYTGATPIIADIDHETGNVSIDDVAEKISPKTKAIIAVHLFGRSAHIDALTSFGVDVIEDCAHSVGALFNGRPLGSWGRVSVFSFYATKVMTTGHGGMTASEDGSILDAVRDLSSYDGREDGKIRYNYRMTAFQASLGLSQLVRLDHFIERRRTIASYYRDEFNNHGITLPPQAPEEQNIYYRFIVKARGGAENLLARLESLGICAARPIFRPLTRHTGGDPLPGVERAYSEDISIPIYPALTDREVEKIAKTVVKVFKNEQKT